ncbi:hypothetical protein [Streptomyces achromogenes]|uniref:hypothetical protein n=1 Tax=Streptomyces achromogenes TaxID=67255 RepID=UPI0036B63DF7
MEMYLTGYVDDPDQEEGPGDVIKVAGIPGCVTALSGPDDAKVGLVGQPPMRSAGGLVGPRDGSIALADHSTKHWASDT